MFYVLEKRFGNDDYIIFKQLESFVDAKDDEDKREEEWIEES